MSIRNLKTRFISPAQLALDFFTQDSEPETLSDSAHPAPAADKQIKVRYSQRAKRMSISVSHNGQVELVAPGRKYRRPSLKRIRDFANSHKDWIHKTRNSYLKSGLQPDSNTRPNKIDLKFLDTTVDIIYRTDASVRFRQTQQGLEIASHLDEQEIATLLGKWLSKQAKTILTPLIRKMAADMGLSFNKLSIRGQKSRWGSCSAKANINLNYCILLLPKRHGLYVLLHELCHLVEFNHSRAFWRQVKNYEPDYKRLDREINDYWVQLPAWLDLRFANKLVEESIYIRL